MNLVQRLLGEMVDTPMVNPGVTPTGLGPLEGEAIKRAILSCDAEIEDISEQIHQLNARIYSSVTQNVMRGDPEEDDETCMKIVEAVLDALRVRVSPY